MCRYSPSINKTKRNPLYSLWNPIIISVSASTISNGALPDSTSAMEIHTAAIGIIMGVKLVLFFIETISSILRVPKTTATADIKNPCTISIFIKMFVVRVAAIVVYLFFNTYPVYIISRFEIVNSISTHNKLLFTCRNSFLIPHVR